MLVTVIRPALVLEREAARLRDGFVFGYRPGRRRWRPGIFEPNICMDIVKRGLTSFEGRFPFCRVVAANVDAVVSHHWENAQNYVYYEALDGGYPLIHNSHLIGGCGYRYHGFDCEEGGRADPGWRSPPASVPACAMPIDVFV